MTKATTAKSDKSNARRSAAGTAEPKTKSHRKSTKHSSKAGTTDTKPVSLGKPTKKAQLIDLLQGKPGVSVKAISKKMGWQLHTTRAALSGLRKSGFEIVVTKPDDGRGGGASIYRIVERPVASK